MGKEKKRSKEEIERQFPVMKEMYESGYSVLDIANYFCISPSSVHNTFNVMGYSVRPRTEIDERKLIYADNKPPVLEKVILYGKWEVKNGIRCRKNRICTDITPIYAPR